MKKLIVPACEALAVIIAVFLVIVDFKPLPWF